MASKTTLNAANLEALGVERLAQLLVEISAGDANAKRRLRLELAGQESPDKLVHEIRKRLASIADSTVFVGWRSVKGFLVDLQTQRGLIADNVAAVSPAEAMDLMWAFLALSDNVLERVTDTSGAVMAVFGEAVADLGRLAAVVRPDTADLACKAAETVVRNGYGQLDSLIPLLAPLLGPAGLEALKARLASDATPDAARRAGTRKIAKRTDRKLQKMAIRRRSRTQALHFARLQIADAQGDVDAFIALQPQPRSPEVATDIANRLLQAGRPRDALDVLDAVIWRPYVPIMAEWEFARIAALDALDRPADAQAARLERFRRTLDSGALRAYLKRLPDFDDIEAEDEALDDVHSFADIHAALAFLVAWPSLERAANLVLTRSRELDGSRQTELGTAAERLAGKYPVAATMLLRRMIESALASGREANYIQAGHHLAECARLAAHIDHYGPIESHDTYVERLRGVTRGKPAFWNAVT